MGSPMLLAAEMEKMEGRPDRSDDVLRGYGATGLSFLSGHVLAFHRVTQSSRGPAYTAIWHRTPDGSWVTILDVDPAEASETYLDSGPHRVLMDRIELEWEGRKRMHLRAAAVRLQWALRLTSDSATRALSWVARALPGGLRDRGWALRALGRAGGWAAGAGFVSLTGRTPGGRPFAVTPRTVWRVEASAAVVGGDDLGPLGPLSTQAKIGEIWIPGGGVFVFGDVRFREE